MQSGQLPAMEGLLTRPQTISVPPSSPPVTGNRQAVLRLVKAPPETKGW
jgi:hypothetical protein